MRKTALRGVVLLGFVILVILFFHFDLKNQLTLESLKLHKETLDSAYLAEPSKVIALYFLCYVLMATLSLPGATLFTLAGGAIFGLPLGTLIVSFASTIGATGAFLFSRFLLRDWVQSKFGAPLKKINEGIRKEGAFYLFSLRLVPAFPFFLVNLLMGLTAIKTAIFFGVSQIGMLPGTLAYVNAGTQLAKIHSFREILSPALLGSFALLGLLPLVTKKLLDFFRKSKKRKYFKKPKTCDYNLVVIGAGSAGLSAAYLAAALKAKVALIEKHKMGGDCLNTGCVPSKALIRSAKLLSQIKRAGDFGIGSAKAGFDFAEVMKRIQSVIQEIEPHDSVERYTRLGVDCIKGSAQILTPFEVAVNGKTLTTKNIIIATGATPLIPKIPGIESVPYLTSDTLWNLKQLPERLLILGGGPMGCEMAQAFQRLGSKVTLVEKNPVLMSKEDGEASKLIEKILESEGVRVLTGYEAVRFESNEGPRSIICEKSGKQTSIEFDEILLALGRKANTKGFGLENIGIEQNAKGTLETDAFQRTIYPNVLVCGDVAGPYQLTHFASHQASNAVLNSLFRPFKKFKTDMRVIPWVTYTDPEIARVGLIESEARAQGTPFQVTKYDLADLDRAIADSENKGFIKVLTPPGKDKILGVTIVASHASDMLAEFTLAMNHGLGLNHILRTVHPYPTHSEANRYVAGAWKRQNTPALALSFLQKFNEWRIR